MESTQTHTDGQRGRTWRNAFWAGAALILLLPAVAMQFTDEVAWGLADFMVAGALFFGAGVVLELAAKKTVNRFYRFGAGLAVLAAFLLFWVNGAVGIIGNEANDANMMYNAIPAIALLGCVVARFQPKGMAIALAAAAGAQVLAFVIALAAGWGSTVGVTVVFAAMWLGSARLFWMAANETEHQIAQA